MSGLDQAGDEAVESVAVTNDFAKATKLDDEDVGEDKQLPSDVEKNVGSESIAVIPDGGLAGWACVAGAFLILFCTSGYANTFGVFQSYYQLTGYPSQSAGNISWIGSVQIFFQFFVGVFAGPLYDLGYFRYLVGTGLVLYVLSLFMTSLCKQFWQVVLAQGFGVGIGTGLLFLPSVSIISQYFSKRRAFATGIVFVGSSIGGICLPIMLNNLILSHGFRKAVQYTSILLAGCLLIALCLIQPRLPPKKRIGRRPSWKQIFSNKPYTLLCAGLFLGGWGCFFPIFYLQVFAAEHGISPNLVFYILVVTNGSSAFGRVSGNYAADKIGSLNCISFMCWGAGVLCFSVFGAATPGGLITVAIMFGYFSGGYPALMSPALISFSEELSEVGIRLGLAFLVASVSFLTGTPICGELLSRYGFFAPITFSGVSLCLGAACMTVTAVLQSRKKGTWRV